MRIGIAYGPSLDGWGDDKYKKLREAGFSSFDFSLIKTGITPYNLDDGGFDLYLQKEKQLAQEAGIDFSQVHGPWRFPPRDGTPEERAERLHSMQRSVHGAAVLGSKYLVIHPIMPFGIDDLKTGLAEETHKLNLTFMRALVETARQEGVTVCLENMPFPDFSISTPDAIAAFVREIDDPHFMMCLDTGHVNVFKELSPADAVRKHADLIKVLHVHDNGGRRDEHLIPYYGTVNWADFTAALHEGGFDGVLSLECVPPKGLPAPTLEHLFGLYAEIANLLAGN